MEARRVLRFVPWILALALLLAVRFAHADQAESDANVTSRAASHEGTVEGDRLVWRTTILGSATPMGETPRRLHVALAKPLPDEVAIVSSPPFNARVSGDKRDVIVDAAPDWDHAITIETVQQIGPGGAVHLSPPILLGATPQVITVAGVAGERFEPDAALRLVRHVGFLADGDIDAAARRECGEQTGARLLPLDAEPIYVRGTSRIASQLTGRVRTADERNRPGAIAAGLIFLAGAIALIVIYRGLTSSAQVERADAELKSTFERGGRESSP